MFQITEQNSAQAGLCLDSCLIWDSFKLNQRQLTGIANKSNCIIQWNRLLKEKFGFTLITWTFENRLLTSPVVFAHSDIRSFTLPLEWHFVFLSYDSCMLVAVPPTLDTNKGSQFALGHASEAALQWFTSLWSFTVSKHTLTSWGKDQRCHYKWIHTIN